MGLYDCWISLHWVFPQELEVPAEHPFCIHIRIMIRSFATKSPFEK